MLRLYSLTPLRLSRISISGLAAATTFLLFLQPLHQPLHLLLERLALDLFAADVAAWS